MARHVDRLPGVLWLPALVGAALLTLPVLALLLQADLLAVPALLSSPVTRDALALSFQTATAATLLCVVCGVPLGVLMARGKSVLLRWARPLVLLPLVLPPVVAGVALLSAFGRMGLIGAPLQALGVQITFTWVAVVLAQAFVAMPFMVLSVESALSSLDRQYEEAAATMGAGPLAALWWVVLPLIRPGVLAGTVLCFARCLGEFGATLAFAGSASGTTRTAPIEVYLLQQSDPEAAAALAVVMIAVALVVVGLVYGPGRRLFTPLR
ncbi:ABC transporter permease [Nesterenkonia xinjiangensis]|uniref:Molybdenum transport system permease n=1 Tax=Nesterenkonia xinjiangensis TaxID=225327 RepID=A0A7Z0K8W6_9MICC|nr:ABC transporter permease [Nesterenkonia xinjiangensis]NYJ77088.1 molybdate transport system permease protein [Nesterenkonia xinjiangensis]